MTLYDDLGVPKDADAATIKKAHRKRVKSTHPDNKEGSAEEFRKVQNAYLVLSNPDRRKRYDETGDAEHSSIRSPEEQEREEALQALGSMVVQILAEPDSSLDYTDMQKQLLSVTAKTARGMSDDKSKTEREIKRAEKVAKRWKRKKKTEGPDMIAAVMTSQIGTLNMRLAQIERALRVNDKVRVMIEEYEYAFDKPQKPADMASLYSQIALEEFGSGGGFGSPLFDKLGRR